MTKLIFVRHGEAEGNVSRHFHGNFNSHLTENGYKQAALTAEALKNQKIDVIYSSDLTRTVETAKPIAEIFNLDIYTDKNLREIFGGDWENVPWASLPELYSESYDHWLHTPHLLVMPNGESMVDFQSRVLAATQRILTKHKGQTICIVTHGTAIKVMMCEFKGKLLSQLCDILWYDNASYSIIEFDDKFSPTIILEGENKQLGELSTLATQSWWRKDSTEGGN